MDCTLNVDLNWVIIDKQLKGKKTEVGSPKLRTIFNFTIFSDQ